MIELGAEDLDGATAVFVTLLGEPRRHGSTDFFPLRIGSPEQQDHRLGVTRLDGKPREAFELID